MSSGSLDGRALVLAAAKASIAGERLPPLVERAATSLTERLEEYRRSYECVHEDEETAVFLVERGHWSSIAEELRFHEREADAVRRAHEEHLLGLGSTLDRRDEFERALDLREAVTVPKGTP